MLAHLKMEDTPENRELATETCKQIASEMWPTLEPEITRLDLSAKRNV